MRKTLLSFAVAATVFAAPAPVEYALAVYGGTAGGVMTAVAGRLSRTDGLVGPTIFTSG